MKIKVLIRRAWILIGLTAIVSIGFAQSPPQNWFHLDYASDGYYGISSEKSYNQLLHGRAVQPVVVAVIDGGTDVEHEDLKANVWTNPKEIAGNGIDDDKNGYADDLHGWNFIGGKNGNVQYDTYELTRLYAMLSKKYEAMNSSLVSVSNQEEYNRYLKIKNDFEEKSMESRFNYQLYNGIMNSIKGMLADMGNENPTIEQVEEYKPDNDSSMITQQMLIAILKEGVSIKDVMEELKEGVDHVKADAEYHFNPDFDPRHIVGDNYNDASERFYGNSDVKGPEAMHGTHVAGIIGAVRNNNLGMNGVADHARIMVLRVVPDGDERDKDVANAIRYAADNGAKVVNMSFGKAYAYNKKAVDDAVKYAESKDVLLVHGSGNDGENNDDHDRYPNDQFLEGGAATNWIEVGASSYDNEVAEFSNYGKKSVDVWAPGVAIYSTIPDNKYKNLQGTSMAAPVVTGIAALIRSYFPQLTAPQVKEVLMKSVEKMPKKVTMPGSDKSVKLKDISVSGGVVNAYKAIQLAIKKTSSK